MNQDDDKNAEQPRPRQSGMERQHEAWVLDVLNFLQGLDIPFYNRDEYGNKLRGAAGEKSIPERLAIVHTNYLAKEAELQKLRDALRVSESKCERYEMGLDVLNSYLTDDERAKKDTVIYGLVQAALSDYQAEPIRTFEKDARGVTRVTVDARQVVLRLGMDRVVHDLDVDEEVCKVCLGLGLLKCDRAYGKMDRQPREDAYPYHHQWIAPCHACYLGKAQVCTFCKAAIIRGHTWCTCNESTAARAAKKHEEEIERRKTLPRIALADYDGEMVWADDAARYLDIDGIDGHLDAHPDETFFACKPMDYKAALDADAIIARLQEHAYDEMQPDDDGDILELDEAATAELDTFLAQWLDKHVTARRMWYEDRNLIVDVPRPPAEEYPCDPPSL